MRQLKSQVRMSRFPARERRPRKLNEVLRGRRGELWRGTLPRCAALSALLRSRTTGAPARPSGAESSGMGRRWSEIGSSGPTVPGGGRNPGP